MVDPQDDDSPPHAQTPPAGLLTFFTAGTISAAYLIAIRERIFFRFVCFPEVASLSVRSSSVVGVPPMGRGARERTSDRTERMTKRVENLIDSRAILSR